MIERVDDHWFYACNVDDDCKEGMVLEKYLKIIKRLPGEDKLVCNITAIIVWSLHYYHIKFHLNYEYMGKHWKGIILVTWIN